MPSILVPSRWTQKPPVAARLNWSHPSAKGLRYALPFNEGVGTVAINQAYPYTVAVAGGATTGTLAAGATWAAGRGLNFAGGATSYVQLPVDTGLAGQISILMRAYLGDATGVRALYGDNTVSGNERSVASYVNASKVEVWHGTTATPVQPIVGVQTISTGRWYTYAMVRSGASGAWNYSSYIDGVVDATGSTASNPDNTGATNWRVGFAGGYTGAPWSGWIDYFYLWTRVLSSSEVQDLTGAPFSLYAPAARWPILSAGVAGPAFNPAWASRTVPPIGSGVY
jgi:hypothetical protein